MRRDVKKLLWLSIVWVFLFSPIAYVLDTLIFQTDWNVYLIPIWEASVLFLLGLWSSYFLIKNVYSIKNTEG